MGDSASPLVDPALGSLFAIPASDWTTIDKLIGYVIFEYSEDPDVTPSFWQLYDCANDWIGSTFSGLQWQGARVADCAKYAKFQFGAINTKLKALKPGAPLPTALQKQAQTALRVTAGMAGRLHDNAQLLAEEINKLAAYTAQVSGELKSEGGYYDITPTFAGLGDAVTQVGLAGDGMAKDLGALAANEITFEFLLSLDIPYALGAWAQLQADSAAFASNMKNQSKYLTPPRHA